MFSKIYYFQIQTEGGVKMNKLIDELEEITKRLIKASELLDKAERNYAIKKATIFTQVMDQFKNAEAREAQATLMLEEQESAFLDTLWGLRGQVRELRLTREVVMEQLKERRINSLN